METLHFQGNNICLINSNSEQIQDDGCVITPDTDAHFRYFCSWPLSTAVASKAWSTYIWFIFWLFTLSIDLQIIFSVNQLMYIFMKSQKIVENAMVVFSHSLFCVIKYSVYDQKQEIFTYEKLKSENVRLFCLIKYFVYWLIWQKNWLIVSAVYTDSNAVRLTGNQWRLQEVTGPGHD